MYKRLWLIAPILLALVNSGSVVAVSGSEIQQMRVERYSTRILGPDHAETDLLSTIIETRFPIVIKTVGEAVTAVLKRSGYRLTTGAGTDPTAKVLLSLPLPAAHRELNPMSLNTALSTLGAPAYRLVIDLVHRLVSYELVEKYRPMIGSTVRPELKETSLRHRKKRVEAYRVPVSMNNKIGGKKTNQEKVYGPTKAGESLWPIAMRMRPNSTVTVPQVLLAIKDANPEAFGNDNIDHLRIGQTLTAPTLEQIQSRAEEDAYNEIVRQANEWKKLQ